VSLFLTALGCNGAETPAGPGTGGTSADTGGTNPGGGTSPGSGGLPSSGGSGVGGATSAGGTATGGIAASTGGTGTPTGGKSTGGTAAGGTTTGGAQTGGISSGGKATGGNPAGGTSSGGSASGGKATGGTSTGGSATGGTAAGGCGTVNANPFSCKFAWGAPSSGTNYSYLNFVSTWVGDETNGGLNSWSSTGTNNSCGDCSLVQTVASTSSMVVFYAYFIGFQACKVGGYCDCNTSPTPNLCSNGAAWIRSNRAQIVRAYGEYARVVYARSPSKPVIWWLEGDFVQYSNSSQTSPLSYAELGSLTRDITCAIKSNEPNAVVAMNHSPWNADDVSKGFWGAQPTDVLDLIWVQGPGDTDVLVNSGSYNAATANFAWLHSYTGKKIMAETSYQSSSSGDRWSTTTAANINARIANGVIGVLVNQPPSNYQSAFTTLGSSLNSTCN
jgi:hypothetical protein